jgi:hypothetical protein
MTSFAMSSAADARADPATVAAGKLVDHQFAEWTASLATGTDKPSAVFASDQRATVLPSGTKAMPYQLPWLIFAVFDKTAAGAWSPVQLHFTVPMPH